MHRFGRQMEAFLNGWGVNVASSMVYLTTGFHGIHVAIGLVMLVWLLARAWHGAFITEDEARTIEYVGLYWQVIVWLSLFPLFSIA